MGEVLVCEAGGSSGDVDAAEVERWDAGGEERVKEERYASCACAEVEDAERVWRGRGRREEEGCEVGG